MCCVCLFRDEFKIWNFFRDFRREANGRMEAYTYGWRHTPVALARFHCRARGATLCVSHSRRTCRNATSLDECTIPCVDAEGVRGIYKISTTYHIVMYVDHMSSQARYGSCTMTCTMTCSRWVCRPEVRGRQAVCIIYMDHMSWQARYASCTMIWRICARISADMHHVL